MASGIRNPHATYGYRGDDWPEDSIWTFRREQTSDDRDAVANATSKVIVGKIDRKKVRDLLKSGGSVEEYVESVTDTKVLMSTEKAMLGRMGVRVEGSFFTIPDDFCDEAGAVHPMAGKLIPQPPSRSLLRTDPVQYEADLAQHIHWLGLLDPNDRNDALTFMTAVWAGRDPEEMKRFPGGSVGVDELAGRRREAGSRGKRVSTGADDVSAHAANRVDG